MIIICIKTFDSIASSVARWDYWKWTIPSVAYKQRWADGGSVTDNYTPKKSKLLNVHILTLFCAMSLQENEPGTWSTKDTEDWNSTQCGQWSMATDLVQIRIGKIEKKWRASGNVLLKRFSLFVGNRNKCISCFLRWLTHSNWPIIQSFRAKQKNGLGFSMVNHILDCSRCNWSQYDAQPRVEPKQTST